MWRHLVPLVGHLITPGPHFGRDFGAPGPHLGSFLEAGTLPRALLGAPGRPKGQKVEKVIRISSPGPPQGPHFGPCWQLFHTFWCHSEVHNSKTFFEAPSDRFSLDFGQF